jgi:hypothetical protein
MLRAPETGAFPHRPDVILVVLPEVILKMVKVILLVV